MQIPAVWGDNISYNQRFFHVGSLGISTGVKLYQARDLVDTDTGFRDSFYNFYHLRQTIRVTITVIPAHLICGAVYLLVGKSGDDLTRVLFLPEKGPPEIKYLRVTLNQILAELATRPLPATTEDDDCYFVIEGASLSTDEDESKISFAESSDTRSEVAAMTADEDRLEISDSEENSETRSEVPAMSADDDRPGVSDSG